MEMRNRLIILGFMAILWSCGSTEDAANASLKNQLLDNLVAQKSFKIESEWAQPMNTNAMNSVASSGLLLPGNSGSNISLIGNPNYLKVEGDTISAYLPFFGIRQICQYTQYLFMELWEIMKQMQCLTTQPQRLMEITILIWLPHLWDTTTVLLLIPKQILPC